MTWFKSRYTAILEQQIVELKAQIVAKDAMIERLIFPKAKAGIQPPIQEPSETSKRIAEMKEKNRPHLSRGNWMQSKDFLERESAAGMPISEGKQEEN